MKEQDEEEEISQTAGPLDPLLEKWLESFASNKDLEQEIFTLWCVCDPLLPAYPVLRGFFCYHMGLFCPHLNYACTWRQWCPMLILDMQSNSLPISALFTWHPALNSSLACRTCRLVRNILNSLVFPSLCLSSLSPCSFLFQGEARPERVRNGHAARTQYQAEKAESQATHQTQQGQYI